MFACQGPCSRAESIGTDGWVGGAECRRLSQNDPNIIMMEELKKIWGAVVEDLKGCGIDIHEPDQALEGALCTR